MILEFIASPSTSAPLLLPGNVESCSHRTVAFLGRSNSFKGASSVGSWLSQRLGGDGSSSTIRVVASNGGEEMRKIGKSSGVASGGGAAEGKLTNSGHSASRALHKQRNNLEMAKLLKDQMQASIVAEDFAEAARIRDLIQSLEGNDPIIQLRKLLSMAVQDERFEDACRIRNELSVLEPLLFREPNDVHHITSESNIVTEGIRVQARGEYDWRKSRPLQSQFFFSYTIRITNESSGTVQLLNRHWMITDKHGKTSEYKGAGIAGSQPVIEPGESFEYTSACPLQTSHGIMQGEYELVVLDYEMPTPFTVQIGAFTLVAAPMAD